MPTAEDQDPKVTLLRRKLALVVGRKECPVYDNVKAEHPNALEEPWSADMSGPYKYVVFNNKTFEMYQVRKETKAYGMSFQILQIDCGENIKLYLDDELFRDRGRAKTMSYSMLQRTEGLRTRSVRSTWYYWLVAWVDRIKGGPGYIGPPPTSAGSSTPQVQKKPGNGPE